MDADRGFLLWIEAEDINQTDPSGLDNYSANSPAGGSEHIIPYDVVMAVPVRLISAAV